MGRRTQSSIHRVGIDFRSVASTFKSGVENYIVQLAQELPISRPDIKFYLFIDKNVLDEQLEPFRKTNVTFVKIPTQQHRWYCRWLRLLARLYRLDILHFPTGIVPLGFSVPTVMNIHDLTFEIFPEFYTPEDLKNQKQVLQAVHRATGIIAISNNTKRDIIRFCGLPAECIQVTYLQLRCNLKKVAYNKPYACFPYIMAIGNIQPRKNFVRLVAAFAKLQRNDLHLIIVGREQDQKECSRLVMEIESRNLTDRVHITGHISDKELLDVYGNAVLLVFPSLYEGFGYPIIEAFAHGVPVVTSETSCMPEIAGPAAAYCDPMSDTSIKAAIEQVMGNAILRESLIAAGKRRLEQITQPSFAEQTFAAYENIIANRNRQKRPKARIGQ